MRTFDGDFDAETSEFLISPDFLMKHVDDDTFWVACYRLSPAVLDVAAGNAPAVFDVAAGNAIMAINDLEFPE